MSAQSVTTVAVSKVSNNQLGIGSHYWTGSFTTGTVTTAWINCWVDTGVRRRLWRRGQTTVTRHARSDCATRRLDGDTGTNHAITYGSLSRSVCTTRRTYLSCRRSRSMNVEFYSGGYQFFTGVLGGCNMQRIVSMHPLSNISFITWPITNNGT
jgi:hypothetical protein